MIMIKLGDLSEDYTYWDSTYIWKDLSRYCSMHNLLVGIYEYVWHKQK